VFRNRAYLGQKRLQWRRRALACQDVFLRKMALAIIWSLRMQVVRADLVFFRAWACASRSALTWV
jgi:hypothetical protein